MIVSLVELASLRNQISTSQRRYFGHGYRFRYQVRRLGEPLLVRVGFPGPGPACAATHPNFVLLGGKIGLNGWDLTQLLE